MEWHWEQGVVRSFVFTIGPPVFIRFKGWYLVKVNGCTSATLCGNLITEALRYGTRCQGWHSFTYPHAFMVHEWMDHNVIVGDFNCVNINWSTLQRPVELISRKLFWLCCWQWFNSVRFGTNHSDFTAALNSSQRSVIGIKCGSYSALQHI